MKPARVVVINLDRRPDRLAAFTRRWQHATGGGVPVQRIPGVDTPDHPAYGCWAAHVDALRSGPGPLLVLEDDAVFAPGFTLQLPDPPPGWRLLRLGGRMTLGYPDGRPWTAVTRVWHTHAYVVADPAALAAHLLRLPLCNIAAALNIGGGQYRLTPATVGQAAGVSDIGGAVRPADQYWN